MNTITHLKNRLGYWALLVMTFAIAACSDDKEESPEVQGKTTFDVEDIVFVSEKENRRQPSLLKQEMNGRLLFRKVAVCFSRLHKLKEVKAKRKLPYNL